jgi:gluconokinase
VGARMTTVGLDVGTSFVKAARVGPDGTVQGIWTRPVTVTEWPDGRALMDPEAVRREAEACLEAALDASVGAIGLSAAMHSLLWVDAAERPVSLASTWLDRSAAAAAPTFRRAHPDWWARTGTPPHPMAPVVRIWALRAAGRPYPGRPRALKDWLVARWTGAAATDFATAAAQGLLARRERTWDPEVLGALGLDPGELPRVCEPTTVVGTYAGVPLVVGTSDGAATQIGLDAVGAWGALSLGTSGAARRLVPEAGQAVEASGLFAYAVTATLTLVGGALSDAGNLVEWWSRVTGAPVDVLLEEALAQGPPADALLVVPYLHGARAPFWDARLTGQVVGLSARHTRADLAAALVDGILLSLALVARRLEDDLGPPRGFRAAGGLFQHAALAQWASDVLEKPVALRGGRDAAVVGAAALAREALGGPPYPPPPEQVFVPRPGRSEAERRERLAALAAAMQDRFAADPPA